MRAYEDAITHTNTEWAPWHIIPADHKWFTGSDLHVVVAQTVV